MNRLAKITTVFLLATFALLFPPGIVSPAAGQGGVPSVKLGLGPGGAAATTTVSNPPPVTPGYATVTAVPFDTPYGTAIISIVQNNTVVSEVGVPASLAALSNRSYVGRVFIDYRNGVPSYVSGTGPVDVITGIALANVGGGPANITLTLRDAGGNVLASGQGALATGAHVAKFINQMSDLAPGFSLPPNFAGAIGFGVLEVTSNRQVSMVALRLTINQRGEALYTTTPDTESGLSSDSALYLSQMADGGGYKTRVTLLNATNAAQSGTIRLFSDGGSPFFIRPVNGSRASSFPYNIPAGGFFVLESDGSPAGLNAFSAQVIPDAGSTLPVGGAVFSFTQNGILVTESGVPSSNTTTHARIYLDTTGGHDTGVALVNPSGSDLTVNLRAFQADGTTQAGNGVASVTLPSNGHASFFAGQLISGLPPNFIGVVDITAPAPFAPLTVRSLMNSRGEFLLTTFPVADMNRRAPATAVFSQIADGGGYTTEVILLCGGVPATATVSYFGDTGAPLAVGLAQVPAPGPSKFH
jgi:hypothetical protein